MAKGYIERLLGERESILLITRQHWFILVQSILVELVVIVAIVVLAALLFLIPVINTLGFIPILIAIILCIVPILGGLRDFIIWWNKEYIVTTHRVIQVDGVINKNVIDSSLEKVNDVKLTQSFFGRIFDFGDVEILTASEEGENLFRRIGNPIRFKTAMLNSKENLEHGIAPGRPGALPTQADIPTLIAELDQLRKQGVLTEAEFQVKKTELLKKLG